MQINFQFNPKISRIREDIARVINVNEMNDH